MKLLEVVINRYIALDPEAPAKLSRFEGKVIEIRLRPVDQRVRLGIVDGSVVIDGSASEPDTTIIGSPFALFRMSMTQDVTPMLLRGEVEIRGDMRTGRAFKRFLADIEIDAEEYLSRVVGDPTAHQAMKHLTSMRHWARSSYRSVMSNISEYLQEESRDVIPAAELEIFYEGVDHLRDDVERAHQRLDGLGQRAVPTP